MFQYVPKVSALVLAIVLIFPVSIMDDSRDFESQDPSAQGSMDADQLRVLPVFFTQNVGQISNEDVVYYGDLNGMQIGFAESMVVLKIEERLNTPSFEADGRDWRHPQTGLDQAEISRRGVLARISFLGSNSVQPEAREELAHRSNYFLGSDSSGWRTQVRSYQEIVYRNLYDGVDLVYRTADGMAKYEFHVQAGTDLNIIQVVYEGIEGLAHDANGNLAIRTGLGKLLEPLPFSYQGAGEETSCRFVLLNRHSYGFECEEWDVSLPLVIDPLVYSTLAGGGFNDYGYSMKVDSAGFVYVGGITYSSGFPTTPGAFDTIQNGNGDVFVMKLNDTGSGLIYSTFIGGTNADGGNSIAVDSFGNAYVTGFTYSPDFPTTPGCFDDHYELATRDVFVTKLNATGSGLIYSTFLGGGPSDEAFSIALDSMGNAIVVGSTGSTTFPVTPGAFDTSHNGGYDVFVTKFNSTGNGLLYSTFVGGSGSGRAMSVHVDPLDNAYVAGMANGDFYVTPGAYDTSYNGNTDGFVFKLNASGSDVVYSSFLGGSDYDEGYSIIADSVGNAYVVGTTQSMDFPSTPESYMPFFNNGDAYVTKLNVSGDGILSSTFLGGSGTDYGAFVTLDNSGYVYVAGVTAGSFPVTPGALDTSYNGGMFDMFLAELNSDLTELAYSTYFGGSGDWDASYSVGFDSFGYVYIAGATDSSDFPTTPGAFDESHNDYVDVFVAKISVLFEITVDTKPTGLQIEVDSSPYIAPFSFWCVPDSIHSLNTPSPQTAGPTTYYFSNWSDGMAQLHNITCTSKATFIAWFIGNYSVTIDTDPAGLQVIVDGATYTAPYNTNWNETEHHTIDVVSPVPISIDTRLAWQSWSDGGAQSHTVNVTGSTTFTAFFAEEMRIIVDTNPTFNRVYVDYVDHISPAVLWWVSGSVHQLEAYEYVQTAPDSRLAFTGWSNGGARNHTYIVAVPETVIAYYSLLQHLVNVDTYPAGLVYEVDGIPYTVPMSFWWNDSESHFLNVSTIQGFPPAWFEFVMWSDGNTDAQRTYTPIAPANLTAIFELYFEVIVTTDPVGLSVSVDAFVYTSPAVLAWTNGSTHTIDVVTPQEIVPGTRYLFDHWSNSGTKLQLVTITGPEEFTAFFITQHQVTVDAGPVDVIIDGETSPSPYIGWWNQSEDHVINVTSPFNVGPDTRYVFSTWSDGGAQEHNVSVTSPTTISASVSQEFRISVETEPSGLEVEVDSIVFIAPYTLWCPIDSVFTIGTPSPQVAGSTRFVFSHWSDSGSQSHDVTCSNPQTLTAYFDVEYLIVLDTSPSGLQVEFDSVSVNVPYTSWCLADSIHTIEAISPQDAGQTRFLFLNWSDDGSQMHNVQCSIPGEYVAYFYVQHQVTVDAGLVDVIIDGLTYTSPYTGWWNNSENHEIGVFSPFSTSQDTRYVWESWSDGGTQIHVTNVTSPMIITASSVKEYLVVVDTDPTGLDVNVDGISHTAPVNVWWADGSTHWINSTEVLQVSSDSRYLFDSWSNYGPMNQNLVAIGPSEYVASFSLQYLLTIDSNPSGLVLQVDGTWFATPVTFWWEVSSTHILSANETQSNLVFDSWSDGGGISHPVNITISAIYLANYVQPSSLIVVVSADVTQGESPLTVYLTSSVSGGLPPYTFHWDLGDGTTSNEQNVVHVFSESGTYEVLLVVEDSSSPEKTATDSVMIKVESSTEERDLLDSLLWIILLVVVVVIVLVIAFVLWKRRRMKHENEIEESTREKPAVEKEVEEPIEVEK